QEHERAEAEANQCRKKTDPAHAWVGDDRDRGDAQHHRKDKTACLAYKVALLFLERPELAGIRDGVADVAQGLQELLGAGDSRVVFDQRLLVRQTYSHFVDPGQPPERLLDGAGTEGAVKTADACANLPAVCPSRRFLAPRMESRGVPRRDVHRVLHAA